MGDESPTMRSRTLLKAGSPLGQDIVIYSNRTFLRQMSVEAYESNPSWDGVPFSDTFVPDAPTGRIYKYIDTGALKDNANLQWLFDNKLIISTSTRGGGINVAMTKEQLEEWTKRENPSTKDDTKEIVIPEVPSTPSEPSKKEEVIAYVTEMIATREKELDECRAFLSLLTGSV